jgi:hypothetical protein
MSKLSEIWSGLFILDPDPDFSPATVDRQADVSLVLSSQGGYSWRDRT